MPDESGCVQMCEASAHSRAKGSSMRPRERRKSAVMGTSASSSTRSNTTCLSKGRLVWRLMVIQGGGALRSAPYFCQTGYGIVLHEQLIGDAVAVNVDIVLFRGYGDRALALPEADLAKANLASLPNRTRETFFFSACSSRSRLPHGAKPVAQQQACSNGQHKNHTHSESAHQASGAAAMARCG